MEKFEEFLAGIWEDNTNILQQKWMNTVTNKIGQKIAIVQEFTITKKKFHEAFKKRQNWSALGIDGVLWRWRSILRCFNQWLELPDKILD